MLSTPTEHSKGQPQAGAECELIKEAGAGRVHRGPSAVSAVLRDPKLFLEALKTRWSGGRGTTSSDGRARVSTGAVHCTGVDTARSSGQHWLNTPRSPENKG